MPGESASAEFPSGRVTKPAIEEERDGCIPPELVPDWSGDNATCKACGHAANGLQYFPSGRVDDEGNFPQYARVKRICQRCGASWLEATKSGTERRQGVLGSMPPIQFKPGDRVIYLDQKYAEDGNTKTHIEEVSGCVIQSKPYLCTGGIFGSGDSGVWRYPTKVPGYDWNLSLPQESLRFEDAAALAETQNGQ